MIIIPTFDTVTTPPLFYINAVYEACSFMSGKFNGNGMSAVMQFGWGSINNSVPSFTSSGGQSLYNLFQGSLGAAGVAQLKAALAAAAITSNATAAAASIPSSGDPTGGGTLWLTEMNAIALGLTTSSSVSAWVGVNSGLTFFDKYTQPTSGNDLIGMLCHEISECMGRERQCLASFSGTNAYSALDFMSWTAPGTRCFTPYTSGAYASHDGGVTHLNPWNTSGSGDPGDWAAGAGNDSFLETTGANVINAISINDLTLMDAIGWQQSGPIYAVSKSGIGKSF